VDRKKIIELRNVLQPLIRQLGLLNQAQTPCGFSMSLSQVFALQELEKQTLTVTDLAIKLDLERSTVSRLIDDLVKGDFVSRAQNPHNRREVILSLTDKGWNTIDQVREKSVTFIEQILKRMTEDDQESFFIGLNSFYQALSEVRSEQSESNKATK